MPHKNGHVRDQTFLPVGHTITESQVVAKQALKKLEDQLTCAICLKPFKDPKLLNCFHVYCKDCLQRLVVTDTQGQLSLLCPTCRQSTLLLPATSVSDLQPAFYIHHLMEIQNALEKIKDPQNIQCDKCNKDQLATSYCHECGKFICSMCKDIHSYWDEYAYHEIVTIDQLKSKVKEVESIKKVTLYCSQHRGKELELYCETCGQLICHHCTVTKHSKPAHKYDLISDTFEGHKAEMLAALGPVKQQLGVVNMALEQIEQRSVEVNDRVATIEAEVQMAFQQLDKNKLSFEGSKTDLIKKLQQRANLRIKRLAAQKDEVETIQIQLVSCLTFLRECLKMGSQGEILKIKKTVLKQIKDLIDNFNPDKLSPSEEANIKFSAHSPELAKSSNQLGKLCTGEVAPEKCFAVGEGLELARVGERATVVVHIIDDLGKACTMPEVSVTCEVETVSSATKANCCVTTSTAGKYNISYQPTSRERHQVHIKVNNEHIKGSPFVVPVKLSIHNRGTPVRIIKGLRGPWGIAINKQGEIVVAESEAHCISIFSPVGEKLQSFGSKGSRPGQFNQPCGVAVDDDGNILVADAGNNCIQKLASNGEFLASVGNDTISMNFPIGLKIHPDNKKIFVSDFNNCRIQILNSDLTLHQSIGGKHWQLDHPYDVAFDHAGNVYVAVKQIYHSACGVNVFNSKGKHLCKFGRKGTGRGDLNFPSAISIDSENLVYITEPTNHRVSILTTGGIFLTSFGSEGNRPGQFWYPYGIAVDNDGFIYVSDYDTGRIQIF